MPVEELLQPLHSFFVVLSFILGSMVGSFCNVCVCRWPAGESVVSPRSRCPKCMNGIAWYDNIPILSWLILGAKCRHCGQPISWQYPVVEAITAVLFSLVFLRFGFTWATPVYMAVSAGMVIVVFQDLSDWTIPNEVTLPGILAGIGLALVGMVWADSGLRLTMPLQALDGIVLGSFIICLLDGIVVLLVRKPGMGFGDMKLLAMLGAFLGWQGVLGTLMMASLLGSVVGVLMILYFYVQKSGESAQESIEEKSMAEIPYPIDPLASAFLGVGAVYLSVRVTLYMQTVTYGTLSEMKPLLLSVPLLVCLLAMFVSGLSLFLNARQNKKGKHAPAGQEEEEGDEEITLQNHYLPFGPYLAVAGLFYMFVGPEILQAYISYLSAPLGP